MVMLAPAVERVDFRSLSQRDMVTVSTLLILENLSL